MRIRNNMWLVKNEPLICYLHSITQFVTLCQLIRNMCVTNGTCINAKQ